MCAIEGAMILNLVPHVERQQVYSGKVMGTIYQEPVWSERRFDHPRFSPVNFFKPDLDKYPEYAGTTEQQIHMLKGDCLFIPAYYYYQQQGFHQLVSLGDEQQSWDGVYFTQDATHIDQRMSQEYDTKMATAISLRFQENSDLLRGFFETIEKGIIK